ncbi:MAG: hypothetical protein KDK99_19435 [Verrucomicrobiales bacterium]|nr:hypothetical protein [Verrucomicrobiales bacterium]
MKLLSMVDIPDDLAAEAAQVEGLQDRLIFWLRAEVTQDRKRKSRYSAQAQEIVRGAIERAEKMKAEGFDREAAMDRFEESYGEILDQLDSPCSSEP